MGRWGGSSSTSETWRQVWWEERGGQASGVIKPVAHTCLEFRHELLGKMRKKCFLKYGQGI